ncbi:hypothetical protein AA958_12290 [Streptomyces sp. CNQ-509]|uniref:hypothetical protein n=1 Tax=unclassified Streptomyces TaxID=2593676 RepID=UPI00062DFEEB|nr:hypothetical protein [Streptomyces sp. CNQ-509]AKH82884.1 hypothetical protein AA958_12290 [Streptomyces sp. CNQ-509]
MVVLLHHVPDPEVRTWGDLTPQVLANFETVDSIAAMVDHIRPYIPGLTAVNVADDDWRLRTFGHRVFNYTYAFGMLADSALPTVALEGAGADYFGARPQGLYCSANKPYCSDLMAALGFRCPKQRIVAGRMDAAQAEKVSREFAGSEQLVVKPACEDSSVGLSLINNAPTEIRTAVNGLHEMLQGVVLLQDYVEGQDVTVPVIGRSQARCLPALTLSHETPLSGPFVFDAQAKATKEKVHYEPVADWPRALREHLYAMATTAFGAVGLRDYARLDCRVTPAGECLFLEVNANPQLGLSKASFAVSAQAAGMTLGKVVQMIVDDEPLPFGDSPLQVGL